MGGHIAFNWSALWVAGLTSMWTPYAGWAQVTSADDSTVETTVLPVYWDDRLGEHTEVAFHVPVFDSQPVIQKLFLVADRLSRFLFSYTPIEIIRIDTVGGRTIAKINLRGDSIGRPWSGRYFEGSSGGRCTTVALRKSFLQDGHRGLWVDGVRFFLNGEPISDGWDHIFLAGVFYRKGSAPPGHRNHSESDY